MSDLILTRLEQLGPVSRAGNTFRACCPHCNKGRADSALSVKFENGRVLLHCHRCNAPYLELLAELGLEPRDLNTGEAGDWTPQTRPIPTPDEQHRAGLERLWGAAVPLTPHNLGGVYLASRGLSPDHRPYPVRLHEGLDYWHAGAVLGTFPALVSRVETVGGELVALHKTYLQADGRGKANVPSPKKLSRPVHEGATKGAAIRLYPVQGGRLAVGEGPESALAVRQVTGWPVWSTISAGGMEALELPSSVSELIVCADNDVSGRGLEAAHTLARRALEAGFTVRLALPPQEGYDWLDALNLERQGVQA